MYCGLTPTRQNAKHSMHCPPEFLRVPYMGVSVAMPNFIAEINEMVSLFVQDHTSRKARNLYMVSGLLNIMF